MLGFSQLRRRWIDLWWDSGARGDSVIVWEALAAWYGQGQRYYHTLAHIAQCLERFDLLRCLCREPLVVEWAIWFHDVVYKILAEEGEESNEEKSAQLARWVIRSAKLPEEFGEKVTVLILATRHDKVPQDDERFIVDIDLSILGQPKAVFNQYEWGIRKEYAHVPDREFAVGRSAILEAFLKRERIFSTFLFRERYEEAARRNIRRSLTALAKTIGKK